MLNLAFSLSPRLFLDFGWGQKSGLSENAKFSIFSKQILTKNKKYCYFCESCESVRKKVEIILYPSFANFSIFKQGIISLKFKDLLSFSQAPLEIQATFLLQNLHFYSFLLFYYFTRFSIWVPALRSPRVWLGSCLNLEPAASKPNGGQAHPYRRRHQPCRHNVQDKGQWE